MDSPDFSSFGSPLDDEPAAAPDFSQGGTALDLSGFGTPIDEPAQAGGTGGAPAPSIPAGRPGRLSADSPTIDIRDDPYIKAWDVIDGQEYARHQNGTIYKVTRDPSGKLLDNVPIVDEGISKALGGRGGSQRGTANARGYEWSQQTPDPTVMEQVKDFGTGVNRGAVNMTGMMVKGLATKGLSDPADVMPLLADLENARSWTPEQLADFYQRASKSLIRSPDLMKQLIGGAGDLASGRAQSLADLPNLQKAFAQAIRDPRQTEAYELGKSISDWAQKNYGGDPRLAGKLQTQVAEGFGSLGPFLATAVLPGGQGFAAGAGILAGQGEALDNAIQALDNGEKLSRKQLLDATGLGVLPGATESIPIETLLDRIPKPKWAEAMGTIGRIVAQAAIEGGQEAVAQVGQNLISKYVYRPDQAISEGVGNAALVGSIVGGGMQAGVDAGSAALNKVWPNRDAKGDAQPVARDGEQAPPAGDATISAEAVNAGQTSTGPVETATPPEQPSDWRRQARETLVQSGNYAPEDVAGMSDEELRADYRALLDSGVQPVQPVGPAPGAAPKATRGSNAAPADPQQELSWRQQVRETLAKSGKYDPDDVAKGLLLTKSDEELLADLESLVGADFQPIQPPAPGTAPTVPDFSNAGTPVEQGVAQAPQQPGLAAGSVAAPSTVTPAPGSDIGNGFKQGPRDGEKYRTGVVSSVGGAVSLEKRLPSGTPVTLYVGTDGGLIDANSVNLADNQSRSKLWIPANPENAAQATTILDEMGQLALDNPRRSDLKKQLKALVTGENDSGPVSTDVAAPQVPVAAMDQQQQPGSPDGIQPGTQISDSADLPDAGGAAQVPPAGPDAAQFYQPFRDYLRSGKTLAVDKVAKALGTDVTTAAGLLQEAVKNGGLIYTKSGKFRRIGRSSKPMGIIEALTRAGGIRDQDGELAGMDLTNKFGPGGRLVRTNGGMTLDEAREWAVENDYLDDVAYEAGVSTSGINDLLDAIRKEAAGQKQVRKDDIVEQSAIESETGQQTLEERFPHPYQRQIFDEYGAAFTEAVDRWIDSTDTKFLDWSEIEFAAAAELWENGIDIETAMEQAAVIYLNSMPDSGVGYDVADIPFEVAPPYENIPQDSPESSEAVRPGRAESDQPRGQDAAGEEIQAGAGIGEGGRTEETGVDGRPQLVMPGMEPDLAGAAQNAANAPLKPTADQQPMDEGLFGDTQDQTDVADVGQEPERIEIAQAVVADADLNFMETGGEFGQKKRYPGFVLSRNKSNGRISIRRENGEPVGAAGTVAGVARTMAQYRNPYTNEPFPDYGDFLAPATSKEPAKSKEPDAGKAEARPPIAKFAQQSGMASKNVAKLLHDLGIAEAVMQGDEFYQKIANPPYMDLTIERLPDGTGGQMLSLAHYYEQAGDLVNDGEMIFTVEKDGKLTLDKTIASGGIGWDAKPDDAFARMFAKNLLDQGFGKTNKPEPENQDVDEQPADIADSKPKTAQESIRDGEVPVMDDRDRQRQENVQKQRDMAITPLVEAFRDRLMGGDGFKSISDARAFAKQQGVEVQAGTQFAKQLEENIELALVLATREIIDGGRKQGRSPAVIYDRLVSLYQRQPKLGVRTSTSMADQAYSTPMPLAYLAQHLAGIGPNTKVFEPTAGNGALLTAADPRNVTANEVDDTRAMQLRAQGFSVTQDRLPSDRPKRVREQGKADVVIMNPPFGAVRGEDGRSIEFTSGDLTTTAIDHAIALDALDAMPDNGRAVMIVGGINNKLTDTDKRQEAYNSKQKREFYRRLYSRYNVTEHFTVDGSLYERQGAGWPVDVIVIDGRGKSARRLPAADLPQQYFDWSSLKEKIGGQAEISGLARPQDGDVAAPEPGLEIRSDSDSAAVDGGWTADVQPETDDARPVRAGRDRGQSADLGELQSGPSLRDKVSAGKRRDSAGARKPAADTGTDAVATQQPYTPASNQRSLDTLIPQNMKSAAEQALLKLEADNGNVDAFVADRLQYTPDDLKQAFSAEQIDAIGLALVNIDKNKAFIIGDQTGIGKGRVVAALLRYARLNDMTPVFVTEKPNLYGDMIRDLNDIGMPKALGRPVNAFMTNDATEVPLDDAALDWFNEAEDIKERNKAIKAGDMAGEIEKVPPKRGKFLKSKTKAANEKQMDDIRDNGLGDTDIIFTTYDQLNTVKGQATPRRSFIQAIMPNAVLVLDESHNAFGTTESDWGAGKTKDGVPKAENRSAFVRTMANSAKAVMFSSATYAKRPDGMDLYARTDLGDAVDDIKKLGDVISKGGVPMQQIVASMLSDAGQYVRRERSFEGISYDMESVDVNKEVYRNFVSAMQQIVAAETRLKDSAEWKDWVKEKTLEVGGGKMMDGATGDVGVTSTNFSSLMHNIVSQMLLAIKADATADAAIAAIKNGEKPVITVSNTMGAFIEKYAEENGLSYGDTIDLAFSGVVQNYLERTKRITVKIGEEKQHYTIPEGRMPSSSIEDYNGARSVISEIGDIPISPIDHILWKIEKAGYKTGEITGRQSKINYGNGNIQEYTQRPAREIKPAGRRSILQQFNEGGVDALLLNRAGSTGLSAHASEKFKDQKPRTMIIAQAEGNIDTHMQMLGRINRTGQVVLPRYIQLVSNIPAEARPAAVLAKKMASLAANTTASRKSAMASDAIDFMNKYGDQVVSDVLSENPLWAAYMDVEPDSIEDLARKATGKMILLTLEDQQKFLDEVQDRYTALIEHLDKTGQNDLEAKFVDLKAVTLDREVLKEGTGDSPFTQPAYMEQVEIDAPGLAFKPKELAEQLRENIEGLPDGDTLADLIEVSHRTARDRARKAVDDVAQQQSTFIESELKNVKKDETKQAMRAKDNEVWQRWREVYNTVAPGQIVNVTLKDGDTVPGVVLKVYRKGTAKSPAALSSWKVQIALPDNVRDLTLPFSNIFLPSDAMGDDAKGLRVGPKSWTDSGKSLEGAFDKASQSGRQKRYMVTGNIVAGFEVAQQGQIMNFSDDQGNVRQGILMSARFNQEKFMADRPVRFKTGAQVAQFMDAVSSAEVSSTDKIVTLSRSGAQYEIEMPRARASGGRYFLNPAVRRAADDDFASVGNRMRWRGPRDQAESIISAMQEAGAVFETRSDQEIALQITGQQGDADLAMVPRGETLAMTPRGAAPVFYSALEKAVEAMPQPKAPKAQWMAMIRKTPGVKPEEIEWTGLEGWMAEQSGTITKDQVLDFIRANQITVQEIVKGEVAEGMETVMRLERLTDEQLVEEGFRYFGVELTPEGIGPTDRNDLRDEIERDRDMFISELATEIDQVGEFRGEAGPASETKFSQYQLPGGENYREVLLTLPHTKQKVDTTGWKVEDTPGNFAGNFRVVDANSNVVGYFEDGLDDADLIDRAAASLEKKADTGSYRSGHWAEPNVLAHVRFNERTDADGKRVLFVEEIQSDFAQQYRKEKNKISQAVDRDFDAIAAKMVEAGIIQKDCD